MIEGRRMGDGKHALDWLLELETFTWEHSVRST
jgi:hypothetical protein